MDQQEGGGGVPGQPPEGGSEQQHLHVAPLSHGSPHGLPVHGRRKKSTPGLRPYGSSGGVEDEDDDETTEVEVEAEVEEELQLDEDEYSEHSEDQDEETGRWRRRRSRGPLGSSGSSVDLNSSTERNLRSRRVSFQGSKSSKFHLIRFNLHKIELNPIILIHKYSELIPFNLIARFLVSQAIFKF
jgi:hypothetical protein